MNTQALSNSEIRFLAIASTIGHSIVLETLKMAAYYLQHSNGTTFKSPFWNREFRSEARSCYFFIQGTGLDILLDQYGMAYNPDQIRSGFNYYIRHSI